MRRLLWMVFLCVGALLVPLSYAQAAPFLATFRTTTASESITLPLVTGYTYNFTVDWGDGSPTSDITTFGDVDRVHTYATAGDYQISIEGTMQMWSFFTVNTSKDQIISLDDDGDVGFGTGVTTFYGMFYQVSNLTDVALFDTSSGTTFEHMFYGNSNLINVPLFDTSSGTIFRYMFGNASSLTTLPLLDTSSGTDFYFMFGGTSSLTSIPLFDTSSGTSFQQMFQGTGLATIPLLNTSLGTNFLGMFGSASSLTTIPLLDTSSGTRFDSMFLGTTSLVSIPLLNTSLGTHFNNMFSDSVSLTEGALSGTRYSIDYSDTQMDASAIQEVLSNIGTADGVQTLTLTGNSGLASLTADDYTDVLAKGWTVVPEPPTPAPFLATFRTTGASESITLPLVSGYTYDFTVDWGDGSPTSDIATFDDVDRVHTYTVAGDYQISVTGTMSIWRFYLANTSVNGGSHEKIISIDDVGEVGFGTGVTDFSYMFSHAVNLISVALFDTSSGTDFTQMFRLTNNLTSIPEFITSSGITFSYMFSGANALTAIPLLDTSNGVSFNGMFYGTNSLTIIPLLDTSNGTNFGSMFFVSDGITTLPLLDTSKGTNFQAMFYGASNLTSIPLLDTSFGTAFDMMFFNANSLATIPLLDTSVGINFSEIFSGTTSLTQGALAGTRYSIDYHSTNMAAPEIQDVLSNIGTADGAQTLTLTGNPGLASLTADDYTDVLAKGWTVIPTPPEPVSSCMGYTTVPYLFESTALFQSAAAVQGYFYYDCEIREFRYSSDGLVINGVPDVSDRKGDGVVIDAIDVGNSAAYGRNYYDETVRVFKQGQLDGSLLTFDESIRVLDDVEIVAVSDAEEGKFYYNSTSHIFYVGNAGGELEVLFVE